MDNFKVKNESQNEGDKSSIELPSSIFGCDFADSVANDKVEEITEFYFESDHLALKENKDYHALLKTLVVLETQKIQAINDLDTLFLEKKRAKEDPLGFVEKLKTGIKISLPNTLKVKEIPTIDWSKCRVREQELPHRRVIKRTAKVKENSLNLSIVAK